VGVDGSGCSDCALARAIELAAGLGDSLLSLVTERAARMIVVGSASERPLTG
jgi:nucleotide-binding universal stress UspA family protein